MVSWRIDDRNDNDSSLTISIRPFLPAGSKRRRVETLRRLLESYLDSVLRGHRFFLATGRPVERNQFGPHPIFSPAVSAPKVRTRDEGPPS